MRRRVSVLSDFFGVIKDILSVLIVVVVLGAIIWLGIKIISYLKGSEGFYPTDQDSSFAEQKNWLDDYIEQNGLQKPSGISADLIDGLIDGSYKSQVFDPKILPGDGLLNPDMNRYYVIYTAEYNDKYPVIYRVVATEQKSEGVGSIFNIELAGVIISLYINQYTIDYGQDSVSLRSTTGYLDDLKLQDMVFTRYPDFDTPISPGWGDDDFVGGGGLGGGGGTGC